VGSRTWGSDIILFSLLSKVFVSILEYLLKLSITNNQKQTDCMDSGWSQNDAAND
jgi:hypothetical protein